MELQVITQIVFTAFIGVFSYMLKRLVSDINKITQAIARIQTNIEKGIEEDIKENKADIRSLNKQVNRIDNEVSTLKAKTK